MDLNSVLNIANDMEFDSSLLGGDSNVGTHQVNEGFNAIGSGDIDSYINGLNGQNNPEIDALYASIESQYGGGKATQAHSYDVSQAMERQRALFEGKGQITESASKIPSAILESIKKNPLNMDPSIIEDHNIEKLGEKIQSQFSRFEKINEALDKKDNDAANQKRKLQSDYVNETIYGKTNPSAGQGGFVDYALIKSIVKECLSESSNLNESKTGTSRCGIMLTTDDGFRFCDADGNIFECTMKYIGKKKNKR